MAFDVDQQTRNDLAITAAYGDTASIMSLFKPRTLGGRLVLADWFDAPLHDANLINERLEFIRYLQQTGTEASFHKDDLDFIEHYLKQDNYPQKVSSYQAVKSYAQHLLKPSAEYYVITRGIQLLLNLISTLNQYFATFEVQHHSPAIGLRYKTFLNETLSQPNFAAIMPLLILKKLNALQIQECDYVFRYQGREAIKTLLNMVYQLDVFSAVAHTAEQLNFSYPIIKSDADSCLILNGLFHPLIKSPIRNDITFNAEHNVCFVTGANMAGKSTLLKSIAVCVLLVHIGFPVPATSMQTSVFNGLITTINLADNLVQGYSHFYSEVIRVKQVAQKIKQRGKLVVVFDELFRGTNVKDAYDSSLAIIQAFAKIRNCIFIISTHITEVAYELKKLNNISFRYMETKMQEGVPTYSYQLQNGITDERLGYWIVQNEKIIEIIENSSPQDKTV
ncbi:DNA mismatch repair protein [Mucilaginibacter robiniae]|uniref:DNA mismatch repair protein n=1 Tax=Mucilaginibacter robiniae TaxID=2728022 RepID=A0A7L5E2H9_9SPHI|nr:DNA mismatch repair protein [Mucilaginibacter robiniae]QJD96637.1 DNA mismatch repair protein [Mucilaginibacter robiniae]